MWDELINVFWLIVMVAAAIAAAWALGEFVLIEAV